MAGHVRFQMFTPHTGKESAQAQELVEVVRAHLK